ncbi:MAG: seryl-tRNA synthetase [Acidimicrobiaceae bacterium]|jgi:seryl-tRNA synthetase
MLDIRRIRTDFDGVLAALARRRDAAIEPELRRALGLHERVRAIIAERDELRSQINALSKQVGTLRRDGKTKEAEALQRESRLLGDRESTLAAEYDDKGTLLRDTLLGIPNLPAAEAPDGAGPEDNVVLEVVGFDPEAYSDHQRVPHWEIGAELGILDPERAAKLSGSMFALYRGHGARLLRALTQLALDRHTSGAGAYEEIRPPSLVRTETMVATGQLPKFADDAYKVERDDLWLIPTAEAPLTSMHRDEILDEADLPRRFTAYTPCFRREAGSAGADTRGTLRTHEFDKVELFAYCTPEQSSAVHDDMLARALGIISDLGLAYRILDLCTGDLGFSSARTFDIEVYAPGCDRWLEVSSVSWFSDYQARRANVRYRSASGKGTELCHTLNGSALAWSRIWPAVVETHRQADGSVLIPEVLHPYFGGVTAIHKG